MAGPDDFRERGDATLLAEGRCMSLYDLQQVRARSNSILLGLGHIILQVKAKCVPSMSPAQLKSETVGMCAKLQSGDFPAAKEFLLETIYVWGNHI